MTETRPPSVAGDHLSALRDATEWRTWRGVRGTGEELFVLGYRIPTEKFPDWHFERVRIVSRPDGDRLLQANAMAASDPAAAVRIEIYETASLVKAQDLFVKLLGAFEFNVARPPQGQDLGDVHLWVGETALLFTRANLVMSLTRTGPAAAPLRQLADLLDQEILQKPPPSAVEPSDTLAEAVTRAASPEDAAPLARGMAARSALAESAEAAPQREPPTVKIFTVGAAFTRRADGSLQLDRTGSDDSPVEVVAVGDRAYRTVVR